MNRLHRDCLLFAATATLVSGCYTPAVITESGTSKYKKIKRDRHSGLVENNQNIQLADPIRDGFTVISDPQAGEIYLANDPPPSGSQRKGPYVQRSRYHLQYHIKYNWIMAAITAKPPTKSNAVPTSNAGLLRYRIWIPADDPANGKWSAWTTSDQAPDVDSNPSLSTTLLQPGKWHLQVSTTTSTVTIQATGVDNKQYTWTGTWRLANPPDADERGYITWTVTSQ